MSALILRGLDTLWYKTEGGANRNIKKNDFNLTESFWFCIKFSFEQTKRKQFNFFISKKEKQSEKLVTKFNVKHYIMQQKKA